MNYILVENRYEGIDCYLTDKSVKEKDWVVIPNYDNEPVCVQVVKLINQYEAITKYHQPLEIIDVVDMKSFRERQDASIRKRVLNDKMQEKIADIKMLDTLEKYAGKDPEMASLLIQYKELNSPTGAIPEADTE
ncbi:hypothetical protein EDD63_1507 [Breznakia blatticola]|uniref:Uncharacterized protein n=1 Tax=Breznakia blatticola TaxID=1754012 RepID=A0A4R7ZCJ4_9FIRM|nr:hypothetical protein [Breznakia blatticola]TDW13101.1 hypothetical protein EDD63_1507 [Breznakia blatticola]